MFPKTFWVGCGVVLLTMTGCGEADTSDETTTQAEDSSTSTTGDEESPAGGYIKLYKLHHERQPSRDCSSTIDPVCPADVRVCDFAHLADAIVLIRRPKTLQPEAQVLEDAPSSCGFSSLTHWNIETESVEVIGVADSVEPGEIADIQMFAMDGVNEGAFLSHAYLLLRLIQRNGRWIATGYIGASRNPNDDLYQGMNRGAAYLEYFREFPEGVEALRTMTQGHLRGDIDPADTYCAGVSSQEDSYSYLYDLVAESCSY